MLKPACRILGGEGCYSDNTLHLETVKSKWSKLYERVCVIFDIGGCAASALWSYVWGVHANPMSTADDRRTPDSSLPDSHALPMCMADDRRTPDTSLPDKCTHRMRTASVEHIESQHAVAHIDFHRAP